MQPDTPSRPSPAAQILAEAQGARQTSERLLPLLSLLEETGGAGGPLDELKAVLSAILVALAAQGETLQELRAAVCESESSRSGSANST